MNGNIRKFLLNINSGKIHNGDNPCSQGKRMAECNKKWFKDYQEAVNYFEGNNKKGNPCNICLKEKDI